MEPTSISAMFACVLVGLAVWKLAHWLWTVRHIRQFLSQFPGSKGFISIWIVKVFTHKFNFLSVAIEMQKYYKSKYICLWILKCPILLISDPVVISQICSSPALQNKSIIYSHTRDVLGTGLIFISGDEWRHHRKVLNPAFSNSTVISLIEKFNTAKDIAISEIDKMADGMEHDLDNFFQYLSATTAFDSHFNKVLPKKEVYDFLNKFSYCIRQMEYRTLINLCNLNLINKFDRKFQHHLLASRKTIEKILKEQMNSTSRENVKVVGNSDDMMKKTPIVFVDQCIDLMKSNELSYDEVVAESMAILFATYETTSFTLFTVLLMLAKHPEVQERVFEEILTIFPDKDFAVTYENIQELKYLDMVINETIRLYPPVPYNARDVTENTTLKDGLTLPKGLQLAIFIYSLHRDESLWGPDAEKFNPDNFLPENIKKRDPRAYMPFSKGSRNCIGWRYAPIIQKTVLPGLIRNFKFSTDYRIEDLKLRNSIAAYYEDAPLLKIQRRQ